MHDDYCCYIFHNLYFINICKVKLCKKCINQKFICNLKSTVIKYIVITTFNFEFRQNLLYDTHTQSDINMNK